MSQNDDLNTAIADLAAAFSAEAASVDAAVSELETALHNATPENPVDLTDAIDKVRAVTDSLTAKAASVKASADAAVAPAAPVADAPASDAPAAQ